MMPLEFERRAPCERLGLKGPRAQAWLEACGIPVPAAPNTWVCDNNATPMAAAVAPVGAGGGGAPGAAEEALLVARLGAGEFFLEDHEAGVTVRELAQRVDAAPPPGVYPVLREDAAFCLSGDGSFEVLAQVCNIHFADLAFASQTVIMTLLIGVSALVLPQVQGGRGRFRIWCDPTFGDYLEKSVGSVVVDCGGRYRRGADGILGGSNHESN
jgi:sarcosine oxidase subunit gamma